MTGLELGFRRKSTVYVKCRCKTCGRDCWKFEKSVDDKTLISKHPCNDCIIARSQGLPTEVEKGFTYVEEDSGYVMRVLDKTDQFYHAVPTRRILEHRYVMSLKLGRLLTPEENVHHINGRRDDNRIENLELWLVGQTVGQRCSDYIVDYMRRIPTEERNIILFRIMNKEDTDVTQQSPETSNSDSPL